MVESFSWEAQEPVSCLIEAHYLTQEYTAVIVPASDFLKLDVLLGSQEEAARGPITPD